MIPKPRKDQQGKVQGEFYPLQQAELIALRQAKLINNTAFVHLALRYENPFCDRVATSKEYRSVTVIPKEFVMRWQMPESSVYEAIAKLKAAGFLPKWIVFRKADSAFFPKHSKRIHLFGHPNLAKLALAQATSREFGITVTFLEVQP